MKYNVEQKDNSDLFIKMGVEDFQEIILNNELHIHITTSNDMDYAVDIYKYNPDKDPDEDDLIHSAWFTQDDIHEEE